MSQKTKQEAAAQVAELAKMHRLAADLETGTMPEAFAKKILAEAEAQLGMRCAGCGRRITVGFEFLQFTPTVVDGTPTIDRASLAACNGGEDGECDFAEKARKHATVVKMIEFAWLSPDPRPEGAGKASPEAAGDRAPNPAPPSGLGTEAASASGEGASANGGVELHPPDHLSEEEKAAGFDGK